MSRRQQGWRFWSNPCPHVCCDRRRSHTHHVTPTDCAWCIRREQNRREAEWRVTSAGWRIPA